MCKKNDNENKRLQKMTLRVTRQSNCRRLEVSAATPAYLIVGGINNLYQKIINSQIFWVSSKNKFSHFYGLTGVYIENNIFCLISYY